MGDGQVCPDCGTVVAFSHRPGCGRIRSATPQASKQEPGRPSYEALLALYESCLVYQNAIKGGPGWDGSARNAYKDALALCQREAAGTEGEGKHGT